VAGSNTVGMDAAAGNHDSVSEARQDCVGKNHCPAIINDGHMNRWVVPLSLCESDSFTAPAYRKHRSALQAHSRHAFLASALLVRRRWSLREYGEDHPTPDSWGGQGESQLLDCALVPHPEGESECATAHVAVPLPPGKTKGMHRGVEWATLIAHEEVTAASKGAFYRNKSILPLSHTCYTTCMCTSRL